MEIVKNFVDLFLHLDKHLGSILNEYGLLTYIILFIIIFCETGLVVTPFLPGDSLVFATGALAASGAINITVIFIVLCFAAIAGDTVNYQIGHKLRHKVEKRENIRFIKKEYLERTHHFFEKYGGKTIVIARFIPIIRTFAPFVAGVGTMPYSKFISYNAMGGTAWVMVALFGGYLFGNLPFVKQNFSFVILGIIFISILPAVFALVKNRYNSKKA